MELLFGPANAKHTFSTCPSDDDHDNDNNNNNSNNNNKYDDCRNVCEISKETVDSEF